MRPSTICVITINLFMFFIDKNYINLQYETNTDNLNMIQYQLGYTYIFRNKKYIFKKKNC